MFYSSIIWDADDDPDGNVQHVAEHDLMVEDVEQVLAAPVSEGRSKSTGYPAVWGYVPDGRFIIVVFDEIDDDTLRVITAYEVPEPKPRPKKKRESKMLKKNFKRIHRPDKLSAQEVAREKEIRRAIEAEFPPLEEAPKSPVLSNPLREAITRSGKSVRKLGSEAGVSEIVLKQFLKGERDLRLATAERLAQILGLKLVAS